MPTKDLRCSHLVRDGVSWPSSHYAADFVMTPTVGHHNHKGHPGRYRRAMGAPSALRRDRRTVVVSGLTGSGKTTVGRFLATRLHVPAIELGVMLRLACLHSAAIEERRLASLLWRWSRSGRLDFDGPSRQRLAAAVPRLDGGDDERPMWTGIEAARLHEMARAPELQEVVYAIALGIAQQRGGVIVGRVGPGLDDGVWQVLHLDASAAVRITRKRRQLAAIGVAASVHDWFGPEDVGQALAGERSVRLNTTVLRRDCMNMSALALVEGTAVHARAS